MKKKSLCFPMLCMIKEYWLSWCLEGFRRYYACSLRTKKKCSWREKWVRRTTSSVKEAFESKKRTLCIICSPKVSCLDLASGDCIACLSNVMIKSWELHFLSNDTLRVCRGNLSETFELTSLSWLESLFWLQMISWLCFMDSSVCMLSGQEYLSFLLIQNLSSSSWIKYPWFYSNPCDMSFVSHGSLEHLWQEIAFLWLWVWNINHTDIEDDNLITFSVDDDRRIDEKMTA